MFVHCDYATISRNGQERFVLAGTMIGEKNEKKKRKLLFSMLFRNYQRYLCIIFITTNRLVQRPITMDCINSMSFAW